MSIREATKQYEAWLARHAVLVPEDLDYKHKQMSAGAFPFLRATFYRWAQVWPRICPELAASPVVLAVGDAHVENFGTWRDPEGRLIWGVNDFDEAYPLPYANDLVRLAVSAGLEMAKSRIKIDLDRACDAILAGYRAGLESGGAPFTLAESHDWLRQVALDNLRDPVRFWQKMEALADYPLPLPESAVRTLESALPEAGLPYRAVRRRSGLGSLGRQRIVALAEWRGGRIAREAKALVPSACSVWATPEDLPQEALYGMAVNRAVRCPDPYFRIDSPWILRRLAPDCCRIELSALSGEKAALSLLDAMGREIANIHLGSSDAVPAVLNDLRLRGSDWLRRASASMTHSILQDWEAWKG